MSLAAKLPSLPTIADEDCPQLIGVGPDGSSSDGWRAFQLGRAYSNVSNGGYTLYSSARPTPSSLGEAPRHRLVAQAGDNQQDCQRGLIVEVWTGQGKERQRRRLKGRYYGLVVGSSPGVRGRI